MKIHTSTKAAAGILLIARSKRPVFAAVGAFLTPATNCFAQWVEQSLSLQPGWKAAFLAVQPDRSQPGLGVRVAWLGIWLSVLLPLGAADPALPIRLNSTGNGFFYDADVKLDLSSMTFFSVMGSHTDRGFRPVCVNAYMPPGGDGVGDVEVAATWVQDDDSSFSFEADHAFDSARFALRLAGSKTLRPISLSGYRISDHETYFAVSWLRDGADAPAVPWDLIVDQTWDHYQNQVEALANDGFRPISVSGYSYQGGTPQFSGIFVQDGLTKNWTTSHWIPEGDYQKYLNDWFADGYWPISISAFDTGEETFFTSVMTVRSHGGNFDGTLSVAFERTDRISIAAFFSRNSGVGAWTALNKVACGIARWPLCRPEPVMTSVPDQEIPGCTASYWVPVSVRDDRTPAEDLILTATSANPLLIEAVLVAGTGSERTIEIRPVPGQSGSATVLLQLTDGDGLETTRNFDVTVLSTPVFPECPADIRVATDDAAGATVVYLVPQGAAGTTVRCLPPSGSLFPVGTTPVVCRMTNECGNASECLFTVEVIADRAPPVILCPLNQVVESSDSRGAKVLFEVLAIDDVDGAVSPHRVVVDRAERYYRLAPEPLIGV